MTVTAYLQFEGEAREAIQFYKKALDAFSVKIITFEKFKEEIFMETRKDEDKIMECLIEFPDGNIMISDILPFMKDTMGELYIGARVVISLIDGDPKSYRRYFCALAKGGRVVVPLFPRPWSSCFGLLVDKFGIVWKFNSSATKLLNTFESQV